MQEKSRLFRQHLSIKSKFYSLFTNDSFKYCRRMALHPQIKNTIRLLPVSVISLVFHKKKASRPQPLP
jgi:hypothetical protein